MADAKSFDIIRQGLNSAIDIYSKSADEDFREEHQVRQLIAKGTIKDRNSILFNDLHTNLIGEISKIENKLDWSNSQKVDEARNAIFGKEGLIESTKSDFEKSFTKIPDSDNSQLTDGIILFDRQALTSGDVFTETERKAVTNRLNESLSNSIDETMSGINSAINDVLTGQGDNSTIYDAAITGLNQIQHTIEVLDGEVELEESISTGAKLSPRTRQAYNASYVSSFFLKLLERGEDSKAFDFLQTLNEENNKEKSPVAGISSFIFNDDPSAKVETVGQVLEKQLKKAVGDSIKDFSKNNKSYIEEQSRLLLDEKLSGNIGKNAQEIDEISVYLLSQANEVSDLGVKLGLISADEKNIFRLHATMPVQTKSLEGTTNTGVPLKKADDLSGVLTAIQGYDQDNNVPTDPVSQITRAISIISENDQGFTTEDITKILSMGSELEKLDPSHSGVIHSQLISLLKSGNLFRQSDFYSANEEISGTVDKIKKSLLENINLTGAFASFNTDILDQSTLESVEAFSAERMTNVFGQSSVGIEDPQNAQELITLLESVERSVAGTVFSTSNYQTPYSALFDDGTSFSHFFDGNINPTAANSDYSGSRDRHFANGINYIEDSQGITKQQATNRVIKASLSAPGLGFVYGAAGNDPYLISKTVYAALVVAGIGSLDASQEDQEKLLSEYELIPLDFDLGNPRSKQYRISNKITGENASDTDGQPLIVDQQEFSDLNISSISEYYDYRSSGDTRPIFDDINVEKAFHQNRVSMPSFFRRATDSLSSLTWLEETSDSDENKTFLESKSLYGDPTPLPGIGKNPYTADPTNLQVMLGFENNNDAQLALSQSGPAGAALVKEGIKISRQLQRWNYAGQPSSLAEANTAIMRGFLLDVAYLAMDQEKTPNVNLDKFMVIESFQDAMTNLTGGEYKRKRSGIAGKDPGSVINDVSRFAAGFRQDVDKWRSNVKEILKDAGPDTELFKTAVDIYPPFSLPLQDIGGVGQRFDKRNSLPWPQKSGSPFTDRLITDQEVDMSVNAAALNAAALHTTDVNLSRVENLDFQSLIDMASNSTGLNPDIVSFDEKFSTDKNNVIIKNQLDRHADGVSLDLKINSNDNTASGHNLNYGPSYFSLNKDKLTFNSKKVPDTKYMTSLDMPESDQKLPHMATRGWVGPGRASNTKRYILEVPSTSGKPVYVEQVLPFYADPSESLLSNFTTRFGDMPNYNLGDLPLEQALLSGRIELTPQVASRLSGVADMEKLNEANEFAKSRKLGVHSPPLHLVESINEEYIYGFHNNVIQRNQSMLDEKGKEVTIELISVSPYENSESTYLIASYNPESKSIMSPEEAIAYAMPSIESGILLPFPDVRSAEDFRKRAYDSVVKAPEREMLIRRYLSSSHDTRWRFLDTNIVKELNTVSSGWELGQLEKVLSGWDQLSGSRIPSASELQRVYDFYYKAQESPEYKSGFRLK